MPKPLDNYSEPWGRKFLPETQIVLNWVYNELGNCLQVCDSNTQGKLDAVIAKLQEILVEISDDAEETTLQNVVDELVDIKNSVATEATLIAIKVLLETIQSQTSIPEHSYVIGEGVTGTSVTTSGVDVVVPFYKICKIHRVYVRQLAGAATKAEVYLYRKNPSTGIDDQDIVYARYGSDSFDTSRKLDDFIVEFDVYCRNVDDLDEIYLRIIPNTGTNNQYFYLIDGTKMVIS